MEREAEREGERDAEHEAEHDVQREAERRWNDITTLLVDQVTHYYYYIVQIRGYFTKVY